MRNGDLKKQTEGLIAATQEQALRTNSIKAHIDKQDILRLSRIRERMEEAVGYVLCGCSRLAQTENKQP